MKRILALLAVLAIGMLMLPAGVQAETVTLDPGDQWEDSFPIYEDGSIEWDFTVTGGTVDFWIEDIFGSDYNELNNVASSDSSFTVPESGIWTVVIENDGVNPVTVDVDTSFRVHVPHASDWLWAIMLPAIIGIVVVVVIIIVVVVLVTRKPAQPPQYPPQQPGYPPQQPPGQYPPQQPPQYPQQPPSQPPSQP